MGCMFMGVKSASVCLYVLEVWWYERVCVGV